MDKNSIIGLGLIAVILIGFGLLSNNDEAPKSKAQTEQEAVQTKNTLTSEQPVAAKQPNESSQQEESANTTTAQLLEDTNATDTVVESTEQLAVKKAKHGIFYPAAEGENAYYTLENDKISLKIASKGGRIIDVRLKEHEAYEDYVKDGHETITPLQLFDEDSSRFNLTFVPSKGANLLQSQEMYFTTNANTITQVTSDKESLSFKLNTTDPNKYIEFVYTLSNDSYDVDFHINTVGLQEDLESSISLDWSYKGLSTEKLAEQERTICGIFYKYQNDSRDYLGETSEEKEILEAKTEWVAFKHQYFSSILSSPEGFNNTNSSLEVKFLTGEKYTKEYLATLDISRAILPSTNIPLSFYFGPNDYETLSERGNEQVEIINLGWGIFGWVNKYMIIPIFDVLNNLGLQIGLSIILLTLIIRLIILPLTYKNYKSSAKMKVLKPEIEKINEKYKDGKDPMKKQQETMALYRSTGVNPMAGCVPLIIQMPILFAAFRFFPASLDLRQKSFLWAEDLSAYDAIIEWSGWSIPFYGSHVSLFTLLMAVSTIFYTRMNSSNMSQPSQPGMPNMKVMMYIFPFMMLFFFNKFASGLSLYYLAGNLISMGLMVGIKTYMVDEDKIRNKIEQNKKKPKKKSKFQQRLEQAAKQRQK